MSRPDRQHKTPEQLHQLVRGPIERLWGPGALRITRLAGDASTRTYHRVSHGDDASRTLIIMELGADPLRSDEITAGEQPDELPFLQVQRFLRAGSVDVPEVYAYLKRDGLLLLEDLGDCTLESQVAQADEHERWPLYARAIEILVQMQRHADAASTDCICLRRRFDEKLLRWELAHFREWLLEAERGIILTERESAQLEQALDELAAMLAEAPTGWVHRDYQSRNLMLQRHADGTPRLRIIDFQDALIGPVVYDLVGLLRDSYVDLGLAQVERLLDLYIDLAQPPLEATELRRLFWLQSVQRKLKDAGRFVYIDRVRGNSGFLHNIPRSLQYVADGLMRSPQLANLSEILRRYLPELEVG